MASSMAHRAPKTKKDQRVQDNHANHHGHEGRIVCRTDASIGGQVHYRHGSRALEHQDGGDNRHQSHRAARMPEIDRPSEGRNLFWRPCPGVLLAEVERQPFGAGPVGGIVPLGFVDGPLV